MTAKSLSSFSKSIAMTKEGEAANESELPPLLSVKEDALTFGGRSPVGQALPLRMSLFPPGSLRLFVRSVGGQTKKPASDRVADSFRYSVFLIGMDSFP